MPSIDNGRATLERARAERARHNQAENNPLAEFASSNLNINLAKCLDTSQYLYFKFSKTFLVWQCLKQTRTSDYVDS